MVSGTAVEYFCCIKNNCRKCFWCGAFVVSSSLGLEFTDLFFLYLWLFWQVMWVFFLVDLALED